MDAARTRDADPDHSGFAVGLLHTGRHYPDELDESGVIYHYPTTKRPPRRDESEVDAIRACGRWGLPMFFLGPAPSGARSVRLCWLAEDDAKSRTFYLTFEESGAPAPDTGDLDEPPFSLDDEDREVSRGGGGVQRRGQARFRFEVLKRYGVACAACGLALDTLIEAAHLKPWSKNGTDDPRNGLPLCRNHHVTFDKGLLGIHPHELTFAAKEGGPTLEQMQVRAPGVQGLLALPATMALEWAWRETFGGLGRVVLPDGRS